MCRESKTWFGARCALARHSNGTTMPHCVRLVRRSAHGAGARVQGRSTGFYWLALRLR